MYQGGKKCLRHVRLVGNVLAISNWPEIFQFFQSGWKCSSGVTLLGYVPGMSHTQKSFSLVTWLEHFLPVSQGIWGPSFKKKKLGFFGAIISTFCTLLFLFLIKITT